MAKGELNQAKAEELLAELKRFSESMTISKEPDPGGRVYLGMIGKKEYYLGPPDANGNRKLQWRVPSTRETIRAHPGWKIIKVDYSQIEVRIVAELSQDPWLVNALNSGKDLHCYTASGIYKIPYDDFYAAYEDPAHPKHEEYSKFRTKAKGVTFGIIYGAGPVNLAKRLKITEEEAAGLIDSFYQKAKTLKLWLENQERMGLKFGFVSSPGGRKRWFPLPNYRFRSWQGLETRQKEQFEEYVKEQISRIRRQCRNSPIQMTCATILKKALIKLYLAMRGGDWAAKRIYRAYIMGSIHDEILVAAHEDDAKAVAELVRKSMLDAYNEILKTVKHGPLDVAIGDNYAMRTPPSGGKNSNV
jgi:DNA polymerase-1